MFHSNMRALDIFGDKETSDSRRRCQPAREDDDDAKLLFDLHLRVAVTYTVAYAGIQAMPYCFDELEAEMEGRGHPLSLVFDNETSVNTPWGLAKAYADEVYAFLDDNDGWNADGSMSREYNRVPFSDFSMTDSAGNSYEPYTPVNTPYKLRNRHRWQPLMESDGLGYITTQEHVTPHIGMTARLFGFDSIGDEEAFASRKLDPPDYRNHHLRDAKEVIEETKITAEDVSRQQAIDFFDNKFGSIVPLKAAYFVREAETIPSFEFYRITVAVQLAVYNGVVLSWREKVRHDLPRPPTIVKQKLGDRLVETYAGPGEGVQTIKASEWEPFIRIMPHSEFPSASSCICQVFAEQVQDQLGSDEIDPPLELGPFKYGSWSEISQVCGDSRVWGGMHFKDAVPAGADLCGGGDMAVSIARSVDRLIEGDERAAIFKSDLGELMVRPL
eukprot:jgi/Undpi1/12516/HiC_scaffold_6.g02185.m1